MKTRVVNLRKERYTRYIGRPSPFGNPFTHHPLQDTLARFHCATREESVQRFREWVPTQPWLVEQIKQELKGEVLGCFCKPQACHGDVLAEIADSE